MSVAAAYAKSQEVYGYKTLWREIGYYIKRLEQYERSLKFFDEAIRKTPDDRRALMGRAVARSKACKYEGALEDIRKTLKLDPDDLVMLAHKALNTYLSCEFEDGLVQNTRLMPKRKKPEDFYMGAMHCANAIENCLAERAGRPLRDHYLIIRNLAWKKNFEEQVTFRRRPRNTKKKKKPAKPQLTLMRSMSIKQPASKSQLALVEEADSTFDPTATKSTIETIRQEDAISVTETVYSQKSEIYLKPPKQIFPYRPLQRHTTNISHYMAEKYLDTMYRDKIFLKQLPKMAGVECPNKAGTEEIIRLARIGYKTVKYKQELLRARRPFYYIKYQEVHSSGGLKARQEDDFNKLRDKVKADADLIMNKMNDAVSDKKWKAVIELSEKMHHFCGRWSKKVLPERQIFLKKLYDNVCQAHFDLKRLNKDLYEWDQRKRIFKLLGVPLSREPSTDSVIGQIKSMFVNWKKQVNSFSSRLRKATDPLEMCYIFHELSRFHFELKRVDLSQLYAKKCMVEANKINHPQWQINALYLVMRNHLAQRAQNAAKGAASQAIGVARKLDNGNLVEFALKTREIIDNLDLGEDSGTALQLREQKIVDMMSGGNMKEEAAHLFKMMQAMPASRRMSVMPGVKLAAESDEEGSKRGTRPSIMPSTGSRQSAPISPMKDNVTDLIKYMD